MDKTDTHGTVSREMQPGSTATPGPSPQQRPILIAASLPEFPVRQDVALASDQMSGDQLLEVVFADDFWEIMAPLLPRAKVRPQGGGTPYMPDRQVFSAVAYVLMHRCAWRDLPPTFGISKSTAHRRFIVWSRAGVWNRLHEEAHSRTTDNEDLLNLSHVLLDSAHHRTAASPRPGGYASLPAPSDE